MALTKQQLKNVEDILVSMYGKKNVQCKGTNITVQVPIPSGKDSRAYRKAELTKINKKFAFMKSTYTVPTGGKTGAVKISGTEIKVADANSKSESSVGKAKFKPSDIEPSIVDSWLSPDEIVENVKKHVNNQQIDEETKKKIINILELTNKDRNTNIPFDMGKKDIPSEFFEVLTSVKLAKLLRANDKKIRQVLGIPKKMDLSKSKIMIKIPKRANLPLLDYFISVSSGSPKDEESALKISVKSKVSSPKTNTVKFNSLFDSKQDVDQWYKNLPITSQREQINQKYIAEGAVSVPRGKGLLFPILALNKIIDKNPNIKKVMQKFTRDPKEIKSFRNALRDISGSLSTVSQQSLMADVLKNKDDLTNITVIMAKTFNVAKGKTVSKSVGNFNFICEKILEEASQQSSPTKYNFYQMFFDEVLTKRKIAYAVAKVSSKTLVYNYYSLVNFAKEYNDWVALRTKNSVNQLNDAIGMDVDERK